MNQKMINSPSALQAAFRERNIELNMPQQEVADEFCIRQATVSKFENSSENSTVELLYKMLAALNLQLHITERSAQFKEKSDWLEKW